MEEEGVLIVFIIRSGICKCMGVGGVVVVVVVC